MEDTVDRLTGLYGRRHFARTVDQADRDRDRMVVAVIAVDGLAEVNQFCGFGAGDTLLAALARVLAERTSVDVTAGRIGGGQLGLLMVPAADREPHSSIAPIVDALSDTIDHWSSEREALGTPSPITPVVRAGVAAGYGAGTWGDAEAAMAVAIEDPDGPAVVAFDLRHPRLAVHRRRQRVVDDLATGLARDRVAIQSCTVEPLVGEGDIWVRLRARPSPLRPGLDDGDRGVEANDLVVAPGLAGRLDRYLLDRAETDLGGSDGARRRDDRASVVLLGPLVGSRSSLASTPGPPADGPTGRRGLVVEVDQERLRAEVGRTDGRVEDLAERLDRFGYQLAVTGFDGGWQVVDLLDLLPVHHLRPAPALVNSARRPGSPAARILATIVDGANEAGQPLVAPSIALDTDLSNDELVKLGLTHTERAGVTYAAANSECWPEARSSSWSLASS